ncbi:hypothetical protein GLYMA_15G235000v4 [Glycine max]|uniref:Uncharacterized protein n=1 Tax=Glycine max TaxID=3847 RepID=I1MIQ8_SOYBN|nr:protein LATERAL ROOT PRIMORDIUM 1 [Glycine max]KAG4950217.1 hypothetical protein JHK86_043456 [Glycine max]KAG5117531.1 hypothetical protein JHK84_043644 [Glycine max]KAH1210626.1 Protein LATERAL ROOT PRIMORDIUM 1 [Glycine max]KRH13377.1 hypothetical protein GLYMA_15G235000v4 [Glycine max]|eukprot:XP_003546717.1 protein LATERAL ROOT PRIMORDIUM 1 [Glycine max]
MNMLGLRDLFLIAPTPSQLHHHQQHQHQNQPISAEHHSNLPLPSQASLSVGLGIFPLLTVPHTNDVHAQVQDCANNNTNNTNTNYWNLKMCGPTEVNSTRKGVMNMEDEGSNKQMMESEESGGEFRVCQDCGNRAKRDCSFRRCRTCCKGRGFDCSTHVKSTWVPVSHRRGGSNSGGDHYDDDDGNASKRLRTLGSSKNVAATSHSSTSNATPTKSFDTSSCQQDAGFKQSLPRHVRAPAVFRCHRVSAIGSGEDEIAYMATVHISGHVFKGFLYDHGADTRNDVPSVSELQLGNNGSGKNTNRECSSAIGVPTSAYPASVC